MLRAVRFPQAAPRICSSVCSSKAGCCQASSLRIRGFERMIELDASPVFRRGYRFGHRAWRREAKGILLATLVASLSADNQSIGAENWRQCDARRCGREECAYRVPVVFSGCWSFVRCLTVAVVVARCATQKGGHARSVGLKLLSSCVAAICAGNYCDSATGSILACWGNTRT